MLYGQRKVNRDGHVPNEDILIAFCGLLVEIGGGGLGGLYPSKN